MRKDVVQGSNEAQRLGLLIREITRLLCGVPDLVRLVLQEAIARAAQEKWATRSLADIVSIFAERDSLYSKAIAHRPLGASCAHQTLWAPAIDNSVNLRNHANQHRRFL